jgi:hypothetical protein
MPDDAPAPTTPGQAFAPGWYPDPAGRFELRFFNGTTWTADVSSRGDRFVDPLGTSPPRADTARPGATAAMVLGIVAVSTAWLPFLVAVGVVTGVLALVFGLRAMRGGDDVAPGRGRAVAGVAMGASALVASVLGVVLTVLVLDVYGDYVDPPPNEVTIDGCELVGSRVTATGTLTNLGDETADFGVTIGFTRPGLDDVRWTTHVEIDDAAPGEAAPFDAQRQVGLTDVECVVVDVTGGLPFGVSLD